MPCALPTAYHPQCLVHAARQPDRNGIVGMQPAQQMAEPCAKPAMGYAANMARVYEAAQDILMTFSEQIDKQTGRWQREMHQPNPMTQLQNMQRTQLMLPCSATNFQQHAAGSLLT